MAKAVIGFDNEQIGTVEVREGSDEFISTGEIGHLKALIKSISSASYTEISHPRSWSRDYL